MYKNIFLVTSAINTKFGIYKQRARLDQTLDTVNSIRQRARGACIFLLEMSAVPLEDRQRNSLLSVVDNLIDFTNDESVQSLYHSTDNWDIVKNVNEVQCFQRILGNLLNSGQLDRFDRCFKMSGRYLLNEQFNLNYYDGHLVQNAVVLADKRKSQFPSNITGGITEQYMSRLWSWPRGLTNEIIDVYGRGLEYMFERLTQGGYADIEHVLYKFLDPGKVITLPRIGVQGNIGPNGQFVSD